MSDAVPKCNVSLYDEDSSFVVACPQEIIILDEKRIPDPTVNMLRNPNLNPYTTEWVQEDPVSGITLSTVTGGGIKYTFNNAANNTYLRSYQYSYQASIAEGQTYNASFYAQGASSPTNIDILLQIVVLDIANSIVLGESHFFTVSTSLTRYSISITAPSGGNVFFAISGYTTSATNSGTLIFTQVQLEPEWFGTQSYPAPWCGPSQTNCRQLPSGLWIRQYRKFAGFVVNPAYDEYHGNSRTIHIQAVGYAWILSTIYPDKSYTSQYDRAILIDLLNLYLVSTDPRGGTPSYTMAGTANIVQGIQLANFIVARDDFKTVSNNLASQIGFYWTIDAYWEFVYAPPGYFVSSYSLICDNSETPDMVTTFPAYDFRAEGDFTQPGSNILVIGGGTNVAQVIDPVQINMLGNISGYFLPALSSWMRKVQATELNSIGDCNQRGIAELLQYSQTRKLYKLTTDACELIAGQAISVTSSTDGLNQTSLLLQSVTARWMGTDETLQDKWEYQADLGAVNRQVQSILNRLFKASTSSSTAPTITQTSLVLFERIGIVDGRSTGYQAAIMADTPRAYYRLGELTGTVANDVSGNAYHGTVNGGVILGATGLLPHDANKAMSFDGSSGYISLPISLSASDITFEAWVKVATFASDGGGVSRRILIGNIDGTNAFQLALSDVNAALVWACNDSIGQVILSSAGFLTGTLYHVVGSWVASSRTALLYVNGNLQSNNGGASGYGLGSLGTNIGRRADGTGYFPGVIDEITIYNYALNATQVLNHYTIGTT